MRQGHRHDRVSIHAPARGATVTIQFVTTIQAKFQSTRPRGARRPVNVSSPTTWTSFNPRAREGRDRGKPAWITRICVSIHAPARGATHMLNISLYFHYVSIHAPARGATLCDTARLMHAAEFQSTRPRGARRITCRPKWLPPLRFNPRAREGRDNSPRPPLRA